jgi:hypothetical protein
MFTWRPMPAPGHPYTLTLAYAQEERGPAVEDTLALYWWDGSIWSQQGLTSSVDVAGNLITAQADHFSVFAILGETHRLFLPLSLRSD